MKPFLFIYLYFISYESLFASVFPVDAYSVTVYNQAIPHGAAMRNSPEGRMYV